MHVIQDIGLRPFILTQYRHWADRQ